MPYFCAECGNKTKFREEVTEWGTCRYTQERTNLVDEDGDVIEEIDCGDTDYEDFDYDDSERSSLDCYECDSDNVYYLDNEEWEMLEEGVPLIKQKVIPESLRNIYIKLRPPKEVNGKEYV